jgi:hypothetical protein
MRYKKNQDEGNRSLKVKKYSRVSYFPLLNRNVEVDTNENTLSSEVKVSDSEFVGERHDERSTSEIRRSI